MKQEIIQKASIHSLCEYLGFDEGMLYFFILSKKTKEIKREFSHSKKYRILRSLFKKGAVAKIKTPDKDFFSYVLLPPSFLYSFKLNEEIIIHLEEIYLKNHKEFLNNSFSQIILSDERGFVIFLLKYLMKESAKIQGVDLNGFLKTFKTKSSIDIDTSFSKIKTGVIDKKLSFELIELKDLDSYEYIGYFSSS